MPRQCGSHAAPCSAAALAEEGAVRLVDGLAIGTPCDPLHWGIIDSFHDGEWGATCVSRGGLDVSFQAPNFAANAICRQLGFPHISAVDALNLVLFEWHTDKLRRSGWGTSWNHRRRVVCG